jgi:hypothetical protein
MLVQKWVKVKQLKDAVKCGRYNKKESYQSSVHHIIWWKLFWKGKRCRGVIVYVWQQGYSLVCSREYWMISREPGFLASVWLLAPRPPSPPSNGETQEDGKREPNCRRRKRGRKGGARSRIIWSQESLVLYKSFNPFCHRIIVALHSHPPVGWEEKIHV